MQRKKSIIWVIIGALAALGLTLVHKSDAQQASLIADPSSIPFQEAVSTAVALTLTNAPVNPLPTLESLGISPTLTPLPTIAPIPIETPQNPLTRAFALHADKGVITGSGFLLPFDTTTFARNPTDPARMAVVDDRGLLYLFSGSLAVDQGARVRVSPFVDFEPSTAEDNQARVTQIGWSPDGAYLAFLVDSEYDDRDGVWLLTNPQLNSISSARQVFRECPPPMQTTCPVATNGNPLRNNSLHFEWNNSSTRLLIMLDMPTERRFAFTVVGVDSDPNNLSPIYLYDNASWSWDGAQILVSVPGTGGHVVLHWVDPERGTNTRFFDASQGLRLRDVVQLPNGQIVGLASFDDNSMRLYNANGTPLSEPIGATTLERVAWSPDRSAVLVIVNEEETHRAYVIEVNGIVREITASVAGALAVEWIDGSARMIESTNGVTHTALSPTAPVESQYGLRVNMVAQVIAPSGLNLRSQPSSEAEALTLIAAFQYVLIIAGPVDAEGIIWWQIRTAANQIGWLGEGVPGIQLLSIKPQ